MPSLEEQQELLERLRELCNLNPDVTPAEHLRLLELASKVGKEFFPQTAAVVDKIADACRNSDVRRAGRNIMQEYFECLERGVADLVSRGEIAASAEKPQESGTFSLALVPRIHSEALDYCKVLNQAPVPHDLEKAATAYLRRNQIVSSVLADALQVLWKIDRDGTLQWMTAYFQAQDGRLDPENVRDILQVALWEGNCSFPDEFLAWCCRFSEDENLLEYWPAVIRLSDRVLCRHGLLCWRQTATPRSTLLLQMDNFITHRLLDDEHLLNWTRRSLAELGNAVSRFMSFEQGELPDNWRAMALYTELRRISQLFIPMMLCADTLLALPDGAEQFAMAFLGLSGASGQAWEQAVLHFAHEAVRRSFLWDMKLGRTPVKTIERLSFGDPAALRGAMSALDLGSQQFENLAQREKVIRLLAVYYASYRRSKLLMLEVGKRYHRLMRMIHEDFLGVRLSPEQLTTLEKTGILTEIGTVAFESRRFLVKRQVKENSLEELVAARINFDRFVRKKRLALFRSLSLS